MDEKEKIKKESIKKREKRIKNRAITLLSCFSDVPADKLKYFRQYIDDIAGLDVIIQDFKDDFIKKGIKEEYKNGRFQSGLRVNPSIQSFESCQKTRAVLMEKLKNLIYDDGSRNLDDGFDDFINS